MSQVNNKVKEIIIIAIGISIIIGGGAAIYMVSAVFPVPGVKYMIMAPFLSTVIYVIESKLNSKFTLLKLGVVFALIMSIINIFMGIAILLTTLMTQLSIMFIKNAQQRAFWGSVLFSGYTGTCALLVTKLFIGGVIGNVSYLWLLVVGLICACFGILGTFVAKRVLTNMKTYSTY